MTFIKVNSRPERLGLQYPCPFWSPAGTVFRSLCKKRKKNLKQQYLPCLLTLCVFQYIQASLAEVIVDYYYHRLLFI